jgi:hypothetical protein
MLGPVLTISPALSEATGTPQLPSTSMRYIDPVSPGEGLWIFSVVLADPL